MTIEEELSLLDDSVRRLKIEFDMFFGGGAKKPPYDSQWRLETNIKRMEGTRLTFPQRYRFNQIVQRYAMFSDLWRQKVKRREEGTEGPRGRRVDVPVPPPPPPPAAGSSFRVKWQDPTQDQEKVNQLFSALLAAKKQVGESAESLNIDGFQRFVKNKTDQLKRDLRCEAVEYVVEVENGQVRLKAKGA